MMYGFGSGSFFIWHSLFGLICLAGLVGLVLFVIWAAKHLKAPQLLKLSIALMVISLVGALLGGLFLPKKQWKKNINFGPGMMQNWNWSITPNKEVQP